MPNNWWAQAKCQLSLVGFSRHLMKCFELTVLQVIEMRKETTDSEQSDSRAMNVSTLDPLTES